MAIQLLLHIGLSKTGTSSIQSFLSKNRSALVEKGLLYPQSIEWKDGSHHRLALSLRGVKGYSEKSTADELFNYLSDEINNYSDQNINKIILSSELFPVLFEYKSFQRFLDEFDFETKVIVVLRQQSSIVASLHNQLVKDPNVSDSRKAIDLFRTRRNQFNYFRILQGWSKHIGEDNILALAYEDNILPKFIKTALDINISEFIQIDQKKNLSISPVTAEIIRRLNGIPGIGIRKRSIMNHIVSNSIDEYFLETNAGLPLTQENIKEIDDFYLESNRRLKNKYGISF